jgi:3-hydroxybutyryl-CoA dehydrogenase
MTENNIKIIGIVGCGIMGRGIAETASTWGYEVVILDASQELLENGLSELNKSFALAVRRGKLTEADKDAASSRIKSSLDFKDFKDCGLVIEAVTENMDIKKRIFRELDKACNPDTILATNTSCLSIIEIASVTNRMDKVLGLHFFNPVPLMKLLEAVKTIATSDATIEAAYAFGRIYRQPPAHALLPGGYPTGRVRAGHQRGHRSCCNAWPKPSNGTSQAG